LAPQPEAYQLNAISHCANGSTRTTEEIVQKLTDRWRSLKQLDEQQSSDEIDQSLRSLKEKLILYRCDDEHGQLLSVMLFVCRETMLAGDFGPPTAAAASCTVVAIFWALIRSVVAHSRVRPI
jgi:ribosomal protein L29